MDIVVIFEKIALTALGENKEQFGEKNRRSRKDC